MESRLQGRVLRRRGSKPLQIKKISTRSKRSVVVPEYILQDVYDTFAFYDTEESGTIS
jgi:hypothetical protein